MKRKKLTQVDILEVQRLNLLISFEGPKDIHGSPCFGLSNDTHFYCDKLLSSRENLFLGAAGNSDLCHPLLGEQLIKRIDIINDRYQKAVWRKVPNHYIDMEWERPFTSGLFSAAEETNLM